jgi:hypothetical protein
LYMYIKEDNQLICDERGYEAIKPLVSEKFFYKHFKKEQYG